MNTLTLKKLALVNFKGKTITIEPTSNTVISGRNGVGKTTIADAISWLFYDKDSYGKSDFEIRPRNINNKIVHNQISSVTAFYDFNGKEIILKKVHSEHWTKPQNQVEKVITGLDTDYYLNSEDTPCKLKSEYTNYIANLFDPVAFRILSDPLYFNTESNGKYGLKWEERRNILLSLANCPCTLR